MEQADRDKIEKIIHDRKISHDYFSKNSGVYRAFTELEQKTFSDGNLDRMSKELIALGISIVINCESCMEWHTRQAINAGASVNRIIEAIEVGIEMGGGPATVASRFAKKILDYYLENPSIREICEDNRMHDCLDVIKKSFSTVAGELNLTADNSPSHPAFMDIEKLLEMKNKNLPFFGLFVAERLAGFITVEKGDGDVYYLDKLSVLPEYRHYGYGKMLIDHAFSHVGKTGGKKISIGIINENEVLKKWYTAYGFTEISLKKFPQHPFTVCFMEKKVQNSGQE